MHLLQQQWRNTPELLLEWLAVGDMDFMLDRTSTTKLTPFQCKNIMEGKHKVLCCSGILGSPIAKAIQIQLL